MVGGGGVSRRVERPARGVLLTGGGVLTTHCLPLSLAGSPTQASPLTLADHAHGGEVFPWDLTGEVHVAQRPAHTHAHMFSQTPHTHARMCTCEEALCYPR